ncbi:MAG: glycoside hydrolase family 97 protein [Chitinophagales bacterium]
MRSVFILLCFFLLPLYLSAQSFEVHSPGNKITMFIALDESGAPHYSVMQNGHTVVQKSDLGLTLKNIGSLAENFIVQAHLHGEIDTTWNTVWGETTTIRDHHSFLILTLKQKQTDIIMQIECRVFDDGVGFRYIFPWQEKLSNFIVEDELTTFALTGDHMAFWIPGDYDTNEYPYAHTRLSEVDAITASNKYPEIGTRAPFAKNAVQSPLLMKTDSGLYISIFEAALVHYPAMDLLIEPDHVLKASLVPDALGNKAYLTTYCSTPWRTIIVGEKATDILASRITLNLNEPNKLENTDWIQPMKFMGIWWGMHVGTQTWNYSNAKNIDLASTDWNALTPNGKHGATTENAKAYIDFAAANGIQGLLIEGWDVGWEDWFGKWKENVFDFVTPYPDFDPDIVSAYAKQKGVQLIMHHETSGSVTNYERRLPAAVDFMVKYGYPSVKTGYVGFIIPRGEHHDGQWMVDHYVYVADYLAKHRITLDAHEPVRPTGLCRTYPNWLACEAARGNEFNAWSQGNPPEHETILPFTRLLGGPMDYTPGIFQIKVNYYDSSSTRQVHTTLVKQLALYVTMYSPLQMAADLPENYMRFPDAFQFIKDVPVEWDTVKYIDAEPGDYLAIARKEKDAPDWYIGCITDEEARDMDISLDFLDNGKYIATIYADAKDADWKENPMQYEITDQIVTNKTVLHIRMAPGGGCAIKIRPKK